MDFGNKLRQLRKDADLTQEELAAYLNVTGQAVSKWECGDGYPEITLLPAIAARFHVTIDALLGTDKQPDLSKLMEIDNQARQLAFGEQKYDEATALMREAIADNPTVYALRVMLAALYQNMAMVTLQNGGSSEKRLEYLREAAALYEYVLEYCIEQQTQWNAEHNLQALYYDLGEREKLQKLNSRPNQNLLNNNIDCRTPDFARGNDLVFSVQTAFMHLTSTLLLMTGRLAIKEYEPGENITHEALPGEEEWSYTPVERIRILDMGTQLFDLVFGDDYTGFFLLWAQQNTEQILRLALSLGDTECAMRALQKSAHYAVRFDTGTSANIAVGRFQEEIRSITKNIPEWPPNVRSLALEHLDPETRAALLMPISSSLLLGHLNAVNTGVGFSYSMAPNNSAGTLEELGTSLYDPLRSDARFAEVEALLKQHARSEPDPQQTEIQARISKL